MLETSSNVIAVLVNALGELLQFPFEVVGALSSVI